MIKKELFENISDLDVKFDEKLSNYTFTKVGGPADALAFPKTLAALQALVTLCQQEQIPLTVLGNASNLIVRDGGIRGLVILLEKLQAVSIENQVVEAQAGAILKDVTQAAQRAGLTGFEFACGIPGSVGGAVFMNAGAYGGEISHIFQEATVMDLAGNLSVLTADQMAWGYRHSAISDQNLIVVSAKFALEKGNAAQIQAEMDHLNALRQSKQPLEYPSCGSVFKRPAGHFAGQLIQESGAQGHRIGGVEVSKKHAGFMVNVDGGTASDYEALIAYVIEAVKASSGVTLEPEVRIIGEK